MQVKQKCMRTKSLSYFRMGLTVVRLTPFIIQKFLRVAITVGGDNPEKDTINEIATLKLIETYC